MLTVVYETCPKGQEVRMLRGGSAFSSLCAIRRDLAHEILRLHAAFMPFPVLFLTS